MELPVNIDISSLDAFHRRAIEDVLGKELSANQRLVIQVEDVSSSPKQSSNQTETTEPSSNQAEAKFKLPEYCNVYAGLTDAEIVDLEALILDRSPSR